MPKTSFFPKKFDFAHFAKTGALFLGIIGLITAGILSSLSADNRQQAAGLMGTNTYDKCDYGKNNGKPICLDSEYGKGNCAACINGEKHILPDSECAPNLCSVPSGKTCSDGKQTYQEGGTACLSLTECVQCTSGSWKKTDRANCSGTCGFVVYGGQSCAEHETGDTYCDNTDKAVLRCGKDKKWHTYRSCGPNAECEFLQGGRTDCVAIVNSTDAGKACNPKLNSTRCASDRKSVMTCNSKTRKWEVKEQCAADGICFFGEPVPVCDNTPAKG